MKKLYLAILLVLFFATAAFAEVNINTASKEELKALPGIGEVKAEAIIKYREANGPFKTVDELKNVYGIGDKLVAGLKSEISVGSTSVTETKDTTEAKAGTTSAPEVETKPEKAAATENKPAATTNPADKKEDKAADKKNP